MTRYTVLTEGREDIRGIIVVPGAVRPKYSGGYIPVTFEYKHNSIIGRARDFLRSPILEGECKISFDVEFTDPNFSDDYIKDLGLVAGVFINNIYTYEPKVGDRLKHLTDGDIREISFYNELPPPRIKLMEV